MTELIENLYQKCPQCSNTLGHGRPDGSSSNVYRCANCKTIFIHKITQIQTPIRIEPSSGIYKLKD